MLSTLALAAGALAWCPPPQQSSVGDRRHGGVRCFPRAALLGGSCFAERAASSRAAEAVRLEVVEHEPQRGACYLVRMTRLCGARLPTRTSSLCRRPRGRDRGRRAGRQPSTCRARAVGASALGATSSRVCSSATVAQAAGGSWTSPTALGEHVLSFRHRWLATRRMPSPPREAFITLPPDWVCEWCVARYRALRPHAKTPTLRALGVPITG